MQKVAKRLEKLHSLVEIHIRQITEHHLMAKIKSFGKKALLYLFLINAAFIFLMPIIYLMVVSISTPNDLMDPSIRWVPAHFEWQNYVEAFERLRYFSSMYTTLLTTSVAIFGQLLFCSLAGYALARMNFPGKNLVFAAVLLVLVIPSQAMTLPNFVFYSKLRWARTMLPLILPELFGNGLYGALFVFVFRQVFAGIPKDLEDAAAIDGAGMFKTFFLIVAPLAKTAYATVGLFSFVWHWNEFSRPVLYLAGDTRTLTLALSTLFNSPGLQYTPETLSSAAVVLVMAPVMLFYIFVQKYFVQGIQLTGIKG